MVAVTEAFFDESYEDRSPRVLCVAGYVFRKSRSIEFGKRWSRFLRAKGLPYFHANECAHGCGIFEGRPDRDEIARKLISLTREYSDFGAAVAVDRDAYQEVCTGNPMFPTPYSYVLTNCLYQIVHWRLAHGRTEPTAFYFEQGHEHQGDAHKFLSFMMRGDQLSGRVAYRAHAFVPKETPQTQPADLLAWLWRLHAKRLLTHDARKERADLKALWRPQDRFLLFGRADIEKFRDSIMKHQPAARDYIRKMAREMGLNEADVAEMDAWEPDYRTSPY